MRLHKQVFWAICLRVATARCLLGAWNACGAGFLIVAVGGMTVGGAVILAWGLESGLLRGVYEGFVGFVLSWGVALTLVVVGVVWAAVERIVASRRGAIR